MSWWLNPLSQTGSSRFNPLGFDLQGVAPIGYTLFAVALGIFAGTIWQKVLPAMAVTLAGFVGLRVALTLLARPRYLPPEMLAFPVHGETPQNNPYSGDWVQSQEIRDAAGNVVLDNPQAACPAGAASCGPGLARRRLQLAALPTRRPLLAVPGHRNEHLSRTRRGTGLPGCPADRGDCLTNPCDVASRDRDARADDHDSSPC